MRKRLTLLTAVVVASLIAVVAAWAGNPHFLRFNDPVLVYGGASAATAKTPRRRRPSSPATGDPRVLIDNIVVVGVREGVTTRLTAPFEAVYVCVNGGNNVPSAANKTPSSASCRNERRLPGGAERPRDGLVADGAAAEPRRRCRGDRVRCPSGQVLEFDRVIFSGPRARRSTAARASTLDDTLVSDSVHGLSG